MYAKLKTNLIGLAAALSFVVVGFGLGEPPRAAASIQTPAMDAIARADRLAAPEAVAAPVRRGALRRHLGMPYVSFAALLPRQES